MTASFTLTGTGDYYPSGTSVAVYPRAALISGHAPSGSSVASATAGASSVAFTGLAFETAYVAYAFLGGEHRYKTFATGEDPASEFATISYVDSQVAAEGSLPVGFYDVSKPQGIFMGATGDGTTDDAPSIQAWIDVCKASGGVLVYPKGEYKCNTTLNCKGAAHQVSMLGPHCGKHFQAQSARLIYSGTTTGDQGGLLCFNGSSGFGMFNMGMDYSNASFTGDLVNVDGRGGVFADCQDWTFENCGSWARTAITARSIIRLSFAIIGTISNCHLTGAINPLRMGDPGVGFVVSVEVAGCTFNFAKDSDAGQAMILIGTGDGEAIQIKGCTFEAGTNTPGIRGATVALDGAGCQLYSPVVSENWFGDAGSAINWVKGLKVTSNNYVGTVRNNRFGGAGTGTHLTLEGTWVIAENTFEDGAAVLNWTGGATCPVKLDSNFFNNATKVFAAGTRPSNVIMQGNVPAGATPVTECNDVTQNRLAFAGAANAANQALTAGSTDGTEQLVIGVNGNGNPLVAFTNKAAVYAALGSGANPGVLALQAPAGTNPQEVQLIAGVTPAAVIRVADGAIGEFGHAPATRPAAYTLNAGAVARNLPSGATLVQVEQVLRQLLTDFQNRGTLQ